MVPFEKLREKHLDEDVAFLVVYTREQHPGERGYKKHTQHTSWAHKLSYARELVNQTGMSIPVLVDQMDEKVHKTYGGLPNMAYVIDKEGTIAFKATWAQADQVDGVLKQLGAQGGRPPDREAIAASQQ